MRLRLLKTLGGPGKRFLNDTKQLKYVLCPVVAQSASEQQRFYDLFDRFHKDFLLKDIEIPEETPKIPFWKKIPDWVKWVFVSLPILLLTLYGINQLMKPAVVHPPGGIRHVAGSAIGDTAVFKNLAQPEDSLYSFNWALVDDQSGKIEQDANTFHWQFIIPDPGLNFNKTIRLISQNEETERLDTFSVPLVIQCKTPPIIAARNLPKDGESGKPLDFEVILAGNDSLKVEWDFGDGTPITTGQKVTHTFNKDGNYAVELIVKDENASGFCQRFESFQVSIGKEKAYLALKTLKADTMEPMASFSWATWTFMFLLAMAIVYYWVRWFARKAPIEEQEEKDPSEIPDHFKNSDKAPYLIPYRSQNAFIQVDQQLFRFADTMRSRQEGLRRSLDIPASVMATINGGGFPRLLEKRDTQPTEYLFLIDEQSMQSHQARLFEYLITFLKEKDVLLETFYYNTDFNRFWNKYNPKGLDAVMLPRLFPDHRLVVMGNGHGLIDAFGQDSQHLRNHTAELLKRWKDRLLISPLPPESWTWKEAAIHNLFPVFPADVLGLGQAMSYIESGKAEDEHQPDFETWKSWLLADREEADVNRRRWHRLKAYKEFLKGQPDVYKWLCALAVCPQPNWETTIAIGKALKPEGVEVTFDKLLLMARVPFLQTGILPGRLRIEMLNEINETTERLAREAIREELEAIKTQIKDGHANFELQSQLAVQRFSLHPDKMENKADIRYLLENGLLDKRQLTELEKAIQRHTFSAPEEETQQNFFTKSAPIVPSLDEFLEETPPPPAEKPFLTPDFIKAMVSTIIFILLFFTIWNLDGTDRLYQMAFGQEKTLKTVGNENELQNLYHFVQEVLPVDSAKILNNNSVSIYNNLLKREIQKEINGDTSFLTGMLPTVDRGFDRALTYNPEYELARTNKGKLWYNIGAELYNGLLAANQLSQDKIERFHSYFKNAIPYDTVILDALHGKGLLHYYEGKPDSAFVHYHQIMTESDSTYFDTLSAYPDLEYLLYKDSLAIQVDNETPQGPNRIGLVLACFDATTRKPVNGVSIDFFEVLPSGRTSLLRKETNQLGNDFFFFGDAGKNYSINATKSGYNLAYQTFNNINEVDANSQFTVFLTPATRAPLSQNPVVYFDYQQPQNAPANQTYTAYEQLFEDYAARRQDYFVALSKGLNAEEQNTMRALVSQFFEQDVLGGKDQLADFFNTIKTKLEQGNNLSLRLEGYDDPVGTGDESEQLTNTRIDYIKNMLSAFEGGILVPYLNDQLQVQTIAFGESRASNDISDNINDPRNSIYEMGPMMARKVELILTDHGPGVSPNQPVDSLFRAYVNIIEDKLAVDRREIIPSANFTRDLGTDELDIVEIVIEVEGQFNINLQDDEVLKAVTVGDLYELIQSAVNTTIPDSDGDGVPDNKDECPFTAPRETVDEKGCSQNDYNNSSSVEQAPPSFKEPEMVFVNGGSFQMGCQDSKPDGITCYVDSKPVHNVQLDDFYIGKYEVTQEQWLALMGTNPSKFNNCPRCPVENVSWDDVQEFIAKLNERTSSERRYRLPTEAEWEYAARGGQKGIEDNFIYSGGNDLNTLGWYRSNSFSSGRNTNNVGTKNPNQIGIYDMSGNVFEWCSDWYGEEYYNNSPETNPQGPGNGVRRVLRGGAWNSYEFDCYTFWRHSGLPDRGGEIRGFRLAQSSR